MSVFMGMPGLRPDAEHKGTARDLLGQVVDEDLCIGCGACAAIPDSPLDITLDARGRLQATPRKGADLDEQGPYLRVCPFSARYDEDDLAQALHAGDDIRHSDALGTYRETLAGHVDAETYRDRGSSGGMTTWFVDRLLQEGEIDAVLHVGARGGHGELFGYRVSHTTEEVRAHAKTRYYPVEMSGVLRHVRENPGRYAVVGLPCFIKAVRLLQVEDEVFAERVAFCVGLVCGHLKSTRFADALAWQQGVEPGQLQAIDFRKKTDTRADSYEIETVDVDGTVRSAPNHEHLVADWGAGLFKYPACDMCDDVMNETADISFGDAWLPGYASDPDGANVAVVRSRAASELVSRHRTDLAAVALEPDDVERSQAAGLRHRREGLAHRLHKRKETGRPVPRKRVLPASPSDPRRAAIYDAREQLIAAGDDSYEQAVMVGGFARFRRLIAPDLGRYERLYETGVKARMVGILKRRAPGLKSAAAAAVGKARALRSATRAGKADS